MGIVQTTPMPPGPKCLPGLGNMFEYLHDLPGFLTHLQRSYGDIACFHLLHYPIISLSHPRHIRYVLIENPRNFTVHEVTAQLQRPFGDGLPTIDGEQHRQQRRKVQPAFHRKQIMKHADVMIHYTQEMLANWQPGQRIDMAQAMQKLTMRIVMKCLFDIDLAYQLTGLESYFADVTERPLSFYDQLALYLHLDLPFTRYGWQEHNKARIHSMIHDLITQRRAEGGDKKDVLSLLLFSDELDNELDDNQIRDHIMTLFAAGYETISNAMNWAFCLLAQHPAELEKLQAELSTVLAGHAPTEEDCARLQYTEWVFNESMRLYPPIWTFGRHATTAFEMDGYHFPAGSLLMFSPWVVHRRPDLWEDADQFHPERWHPERAKQIVPWSYFPFGAGPRICIGMPFAQLEAKLLLATILQQYTPRLLPDYRPVPHALLTLRPRNGLPMILEKV